MIWLENFESWLCFCFSGILNFLFILLLKAGDVLFQFKMKPQMHYGEDDCPVSPPSSFPTEDELHFEIEMIEFAKVKARHLNLESISS